jgi:hypothetical protein
MGDNPDIYIRLLSPCWSLLDMEPLNMELPKVEPGSIIQGSIIQGSIT